MCRANIVVSGEDVGIDVLAFGLGREGSDKAFEKMEQVLADLGYGNEEKVRSY
jgi:hypothetical protein